MSKSSLQQEIAKRRTFAIISHPDAGKTTITEKLILLGQLIQVAGTVKGKKNDRAAIESLICSIRLVMRIFLRILTAP